MSSADEETNSDVEYKSTESEYLNSSEDEENLENERHFIWFHLKHIQKLKETEPNINNFRWRKRSPIPFSLCLYGQSF